MKQIIADVLARSFSATLLVSCGYLAGYLHATDMPENAAPGFMLGFSAAAGFVVAALLADKYGVFERLGITDDDRGQMDPMPHVPIVFMMVLLIGVIVTAEVFERMGYDEVTIAELIATVEPVVQLVPLVFAGFVLVVLLPMFGIPVPVGYDRGKIKWLTWCHTGMHAHICYWHGSPGGDRAGGLQSIHPDDLDGDRS